MIKLYMLCLISAMLLFATGCTHAVILKAKMENSRPCFKVNTYHVNYIDEVTIWNKQTADLIWRIKFWDFGRPIKNLTISYGNAPAGMKQIFPKDGKPPRDLKPGDVIALEVTYQYDIPYAACMGHKTAGFKILENGKIQEMPFDKNVNDPKNPGMH